MPNDPRFYIRDKYGEAWTEVPARDIYFLNSFLKFSVSGKARAALRVMEYGW